MGCAATAPGRGRTHPGGTGSGPRRRVPPQGGPRAGPWGVRRTTACRLAACAAPATTPAAACGNPRRHTTQTWRRCARHARCTWPGKGRRWVKHHNGWGKPHVGPTTTTSRDERWWPTTQNTLCSRCTASRYQYHATHVPPTRQRWPESPGAERLQVAQHVSRCAPPNQTPATPKS